MSYSSRNSPGVIIYAMKIAFETPFVYCTVGAIWIELIPLHISAGVPIRVWTVPFSLSGYVLQISIADSWHAGVDSLWGVSIFNYPPRPLPACHAASTQVRRRTAGERQQNVNDPLQRADCSWAKPTNRKKKITRQLAFQKWTQRGEGRGNNNESKRITEQRHGSITMVILNFISAIWLFQKHLSAIQSEQSFVIHVGLQTSNIHAKQRKYSWNSSFQPEQPSVLQRAGTK